MENVSQIFLHILIVVQIVLKCLARCVCVNLSCTCGSMGVLCVCLCLCVIVRDRLGLL